MRWALAALLLVLAIGAACWPKDADEEGAALVRLPPSSVPSKERLATEYVPRTSIVERASRSRVRQPVTNAPAPKARTAPRPAASGDLLDRLAMCESGGDPRKNTGNGFYGAFQWLPRTWWALAMGGKGRFGETQRQAAIANVLSTSYEGQKAVAARIPVSSWGRQFPVCARRLGVA